MATIAIQVAVVVAINVLQRVLTPKPKAINNQGTRLDQLTVTSSTEGATINRLYGRMRLGGQMIWATQFKEVANTTSEKVSGGKGGSKSQTVNTTTYAYYVSFAVAFCEGNRKASLSRLWADGAEVDLSKYNFRFYPGNDTQTADPKIQAVEGAANVPAYRGITYLVFEDLPLADFGSRIPQMTAEIVVPLITTDPDDIQNCAKAFCLIPGSGETIYGSQQYNQTYTTGASVWELQQVNKPDNVHNNFKVPDANLALDNLYRMQDNLQAIELVVSWFATDLRASNCSVIPKHESFSRTITPTEWQVGSYTRAGSQRVSWDTNNRPYFGGTPSDSTVVERIQAIKAAGKRVVFYPFLMCDIPPGNTLPDPYSNGAAVIGQPVFPWRGRITCSPAFGFTSTPDLSTAAATQVNNFFTRSDGYRNFILHYANLCVSAGGVDAIIIGSELVGLTTVRSAAGVYPAVAQLMTLADDVKAIVGSSCKVGYAADWSEFVHDSPQGFYFNLDPLWAKSSVNFVGVDNYLPLSDWRDGNAHLDYNPVTGPVSEFEPTYLKGQVEGGEYYDYYYASYADRVAQNRTPITDGAYGKPWINRRKDFRNWWANYHYNRPSGVEDTAPTAWVPYSKPLWFTEVGCPAVDKGSNQPNVFYDPKSSESNLPYFSRGTRDDFIQRVFLESFITYWRDNSPSQPGTPSNKMIDPNNIFVWCWDARPFPDYPARSNIWSDGNLWFFGHWLTGRIDAVPLARLIAHFCEMAGIDSTKYDTSGLYGPNAIVRGYNIDSVEAMRDMIEKLSNGYLFDSYESEGKVKFVLRSNTKQQTISSDYWVVSDEDPVGCQITRSQETDLPSSVKISFIDEFNDYQTASVDGKTAKGYSQNVDTLELPIILTEAYVRSLADSLVQQAWMARESGTVTLPPSFAGVEPGDVITTDVGSRTLNLRIAQIDTTEARSMQVATFDIGMFALPPTNEQNRVPPVADIYGSVYVEWVDVPLLTGQEDLPWSPRLAASSDPWPGSVNVYRQLADGTFTYSTTISTHLTMGILTSPLYSGPTDRWDRGNTFLVNLDYGQLSSNDELVVLEQGIALAIQNTDGQWEVVQFASAVLQSPGVYLVSDLLRGQLGTKTAMRSPVAAGARVVLLEPGRLPALNVTEDLVTLPLVYRWGPAQYDQTDTSYQQGTRYGTRAGLRPYSPCCGFIDRDASGNITIRWSRRTRFGGDGWDAAEVPLNEEYERYKLQIINGSTVVREVIVTSPQYLYTAASIVADFGSAQTSLSLSIQQFGPRYGDYGPALTGTYILRSSL